MRFLGCSSKAKTEECDQKNLDVFNQFRIAIPCSATYFLEVRAHVPLKVATKGSLRGKKLLKFRFLGCFSIGKNVTKNDKRNYKNLVFKADFLKERRGSATQKIEVSLINLQPFTKYLRLTLVFIRNSALREKFHFRFSRAFF